MAKKTYEKPAILHSETITTRAVACDKSDATCSGGVISS
jgi:hypothetical protein